MMRFAWLAPLVALSCANPLAVLRSEAVPDAKVIGRVEIAGTAPTADLDDPPRSKAIAAVGPKTVGKRGRVDSNAQPFVHFARPMVAEPSALRFELTPAVAGETVWIDPYRAYFSPTGSFELGRHYEVRARGTARRDDGTQVEIDERWEFDTRPPVVTLEIDEGPSQWWFNEAMPAVDDAERTTHWRVGVAIGSEEKITIAGLRRHVSARAWPIGSTAAAARPVAVKLLSGDRDHGLPKEYEWSAGSGIHVHPATSWPADHVVEVTVDGAFAPRGTGPIGEPVSKQFRVTKGPTFDVSCNDDHDDGCGRGGVSLRFAAPMAKRDLARIRVTPRPPALDVVVHDEQQVSIYGEFTIGESYRVVVPKGLRDRVGQKLIGETTRTVAFVPPPPEVDLVATSGVLRPGLPATVGLESRWVRKAILRAAVPSEKAWLALQNTNLDEAPFPTDVTGLVEREIDLAPSGRYAWSSIALDVAALAGGKRPLIVEVVPKDVLDVAKDRRKPTPTRGLYQVTDHGLAVWRSPAATRVQVRDNGSLEPEIGIEVEIHDNNGKRVHRTVTDREGFASLGSDRALPEHALLVARSKDSVALAKIGTAAPDERTHHGDLGEDRWLAAVVTERALYRPGETVSIVGWTAVSTTRSAHGLLRPKAGAPVELELLDHRDEVVARRTVAITKHGKFWGRIALPTEGSLGRYRARAKLPERGSGLTHMAAIETDAYFSVRDVEVPAFEVRTQTTDANVVRPAKVEVVAHASYYFGGAVPITKDRADTRCSRTSSNVPGLESGWEVARPLVDGEEPWGWSLVPELARGPAGEARYTVDTKPLPAGVDVVCDTDLAIQDASFTEVGGSERWYVHPSRYLVVRPQLGETSHALDIRAVDEDGKVRVAQDAVVEIEKYEEHRTKSGNVEQKPVRLHRCRLSTTTSGADARCTAPKLKPGRYLGTVTATIDGRKVKHEETWYVWERADPPPKPRDRPTRLELSVDTSAPKPGHALKVSMLAPKVSGPGVLAFSHGGLRKLIPFELKDGEAALELPVTDAWVPSVELSAFVVTRGATDSDPPDTWRDDLSVSVGPEHRRLGVTVEAPDTAAAGDAVSITVRVVGSDDRPVNGRVALWAVDEAIHAMVEPRIPALVETFAIGRNVDDAFFETYSDVLRPYTVRDDPFEGGTYGHGGGSGYGSGSGAGFGGRGATGPQPARKRFEATPIFVGDAEVKNGVAVIDGRMPENLSTFRVTAIASADVESGPGLGRFGHNDTRIQLTAPLVVRSAMPRMLRPGDETELAVLVDNLGAGAGRLDVEVVAVKGADLVQFVGKPSAGKDVESGTQERFPFTIVAKKAGTVELELRARLHGKTVVQDAMRATLPIEAPPELRKHAATYGSIADDGAFAIALERPKDATTKRIAVDVELSGSMLGDLQSMARDLVEYPYGCVEQTSSGLLPLAALAGLSHQGYLDVDVREHIDVGIARLRSMQVDGRGLGYWPGARTVHVYGTAYALWVLETLKASGHEVPASLRTGMRDELLARIGESATADTPEEIGLDDVAATMAVHALVTAGAKPTKTIERLFLARDELPTFARALLLLAAHPIDPKGAIATSLAKELFAQIDERQGTASVRSSGSYYDEYFDSSARTHALVMLALVRVAPDDPRLEKLARGLGVARGEGRIANTQERAYTMLALAEYARRREKDVPDMSTRVWLGEQSTPSAVLRGRTPKPVLRSGTVEMSSEEPKVTLARAGKGRLYYRVGMSWTPNDAGRVPVTNGFAIERSLRTTDGKGTAIAAGDLVAMDVVVTVDRSQRYVAIEVPLPPGLEAVDTSLGKGGRARVIAGGRGGWVSHEELRRDKAVIFADLLSPGEHRTTVFLRAIAAGTYDMPPAVVHAMYMPELNGNTARAKVEVAQRK
jgi:hypothetical protein